MGRYFIYTVKFYLTIVDIYYVRRDKVSMPYCGGVTLGLWIPFNKPRRVLVWN